MAKKRGAARMRRYSSEVWQVGAARLPQWMTRSDGEVCQGWMAVCVRKGPNSFQLSEIGPEEEIPRLLEGVVERALRSWRTRPWRIQVADPAWVPALESALAPRDLVVEVEEDLPVLSGLLESLPRRMALLDPRPGALTGEGVTPDRLAALARAAATFIAASGWRHLSEDDLIRIEAPETGPGLGFFVLSHPGARSAPSLIFFPDVRTFESTFFFDDDPDDFDEDPGLFDPGESTLLAAADEELDVDEELDEAEELDTDEKWEEPEEDDAEREEPEDEEEWMVELLSPSAAPAGDVELWQAHGLPWAGEKLLPVATLRTDRAVLRPDHRQLAFFEGLLTALAATSEEEIDTGRWEKRVSTAEGEVRFVLSLPGLLEPEDEEPVFTLAPPEELSPRDHAEDLLGRAEQTLGRRGVHLARQALEVWPDCADAYGFLARRAPDRESSARLYELGMAAGERAMGAGAFEQAGYFWRILETRPYMRARAGLAKVLVEQKRLGEAVEHYQEMLRLNPNDSQGVRDILVNLLIELGRDEEAWRLVEAYSEDGALLAFPRALLLYRRGGDSQEARRALKEAVRFNLFVPGMLLGDLDPPPREPFYAPSGLGEAGLYLALSRRTWYETEGALEWLRKRTALPPRPAKRKGKRKGKKARRR